MPRRINDSDDDNAEDSSEANIDFDNSVRKDENAQTKQIANTTAYRRAK
jgi:hypothetical protein